MTQERNGIVSSILTSSLGLIYIAYMVNIISESNDLRYMVVVFDLTIIAICGAVCAYCRSNLLSLLSFLNVWIIGAASIYLYPEAMAKTLFGSFLSILLILSVYMRSFILGLSGENHNAIRSP